MIGNELMGYRIDSELLEKNLIYLYNYIKKFEDDEIGVRDLSIEIEELELSDFVEELVILCDSFREYEKENDCYTEES